MSAEVAGSVVEVVAPAKVNLRLHVLSERPDGYHEVATLFQAIDLCDTIQVRATGGSGIELDVVGPDLGPAGDNLAVRAAEHYLRVVRPGHGLRLTLTKRIPAGAGLGGGSADAAATLRALEVLFARPFPEGERQAVAAQLGSDVPFFLGPAATAFGRGRGERLESLAPLPPAALVLGMPPVHVSTARAYGLLAEHRRGTPVDPRHSTDAPGVERDPATARAPNADDALARAGPAAPSGWHDVALQAVNDFEIVIPAAFPEVARARRAVAEAGNPLFALLSGSGGAVFAVHATRRAAEDAAAEASRRLPSCPFVAVSTLSRIPDPVLMRVGESTNQE